MKEQSEKKMESSVMKDNRLRIPNITRNLYISLSVLAIIAIENRAFWKIDFSKTPNWGNGFWRFWGILGVVELSYTCYRSNLCKRLGNKSNSKRCTRTTTPKTVKKSQKSPKIMFFGILTNFGVLLRLLLYSVGLETWHGCSLGLGLYAV